MQKKSQQRKPTSEWKEYYDNIMGASYYYNSKTGEATWLPPDDVVDTQSIPVQNRDPTQTRNVQPMKKKKSPRKSVYKENPPQDFAFIIQSPREHVQLSQKPSIAQKKQQVPQSVQQMKRQQK